MKEVPRDRFGVVIAAKIVVQMNKLHFKDGNGDPRGFKKFRDDHTHVDSFPAIEVIVSMRCSIFVFIEHHALFTKYLEQGPTCGGLRASLLVDFVSVLGHIEM